MMQSSSGREHTIVYNVYSLDDNDYLMETRRKPPTGRQSPSLFNKWHGIFYMPSRIDTAGHTKAFDYPVAEHWGAEMFSPARTRTDNTSAHSGRATNSSIPGLGRGRMCEKVSLVTCRRSVVSSGCSGFLHQKTDFIIISPP